MPRSPLPNMSVGDEPLLDGVGAAFDVELDELLLLPHAASTAPNAATAPVDPSALRNFARDAGSRSSSSIADRPCGRSGSWVIGWLLVLSGEGRARCRTHARERSRARRARSAG